MHFKRTLVLRPKSPKSHNQPGVTSAAHSALHIRQGDPDLHNNLGLALAARGRLADAVSQYERALSLDPDHAGAHYNLGLAAAALGRMADAIANYRRALAIHPENAGAHYNLGIALAAHGRIDAAVLHYKCALTINPDYAEAHNNLGFILNQQGKREDAVAHLARAVVLSPDNTAIRNTLSLALAAQGRFDDAILHLRHALIVTPHHAATHSNLGVVLVAQGRIDEALAHYEQALAINPTLVEAHNNLGNIFKSQGKFGDAMTQFELAIAIKPDYAEAHFNRAEIKTFHAKDRDLTALLALTDKRDVGAGQKMYIHFAAAKALEDSKDYARAFEHMQKGNALKRGQINYDETSVLKLFERMSATFDKNLFHRFEGQGHPSSVPVFVLGMPRSGSTLIEQILASHPLVHGAGELGNLDRIAGAIRREDGQPVQYPERVGDLDGADLRRLARSYLASLPAVDGKLRITDKLPGNFLNIGLIRLILPNARIIHTMRNPVDTCLSCYSKLFASGLDYTFDLGELGRYFRSYSALMEHWRRVLPADAMLDVAYEDVVDDLEGQARRLIDYCGLPWDDRCIDFYRTSRPVKTASAVQVRTPLFRSSLQRWRRYEAGLAPLLTELRDVMPDGARGELARFGMDVPREMGFFGQANSAAA